MTGSKEALAGGGGVWSEWERYLERELAQRAWEGYRCGEADLPAPAGWEAWDALTARLDAAPRSVPLDEREPAGLDEIRARRRSAEHRYALGAVLPELEARLGEGWAGYIAGGPVDPVDAVALAVLESAGAAFDTTDLGRAWLERLPYLGLAGAERVTYAQLVREAGTWEELARRNPYRQDERSLARGIIYGFVSPGRPSLAASLAWRAARLSYTGSGLYGAMFVAATTAAAFVAQDPEEMLYIGISEVPDGSPLNEAVRAGLRAYRRGADREEAFAAAQALFDRPRPAPHALDGALLLTLALLYCGTDKGNSPAQPGAAPGVVDRVAGGILGVHARGGGGATGSAGGVGELASRTAAVARAVIGGARS